VTAAADPGHATVTTLASAPRQVAVPVQTGTEIGHLINYNSIACLGISGNDSNAPAIQWPCNTVGQTCALIQWGTGQARPG
jgi:hypothetical protein